MKLDILEETTTLTRLALNGRLDTGGVDKVETRLNAVLARGTDGVIDLSEVTLLTSMGIRMLLAAAKMLNRRGARLVLIAPRPLVEQSLRHTSLDDLIPVAPDLDAAKALLAT